MTTPQTPEDNQNSDSNVVPDAASGSGMKRSLYIAATALVFVLCLAAAVAWFQARSFMTTPPQEQGSEVRIVVPSGATFDAVARQLKDAGAITDTGKFRLLARYRKKLGSIKAGEFLISTGWTPDRVLETLVSGKSVLYKLHFREGLTWWQIAKSIEQQGFAKASDLEAVFSDPVFLKKHHIPFASAEGFLFPETYHLLKPRNMTPESARTVATMLVDMFWRKAEQIWPQIADGKYPAPQELRRLLILATLVEKETGAAHERTRIAGVYANRLRKGMLMQADPTVIYGLGTAFDGNIKRSHLRDPKNPYNTYKHRGLPPGPICSPGIEALKAAANPEKHSYLYFVAKGDGTHYFSKSLREHNNAVIKYQLKGRRRKK